MSYWYTGRDFWFSGTPLRGLWLIVEIVDAAWSWVARFQFFRYLVELIQVLEHIIKGRRQLRRLQSGGSGRRRTAGRFIATEAHGWILVVVMLWRTPGVGRAVLVNWRFDQWAMQLVVYCVLISGRRKSTTSPISELGCIRFTIELV